MASTTTTTAAIAAAPIRPSCHEWPKSKPQSLASAKTPRARPNVTRNSTTARTTIASILSRSSVRARLPDAVAARLVGRRCSRQVDHHGRDDLILVHPGSFDGLDPVAGRRSLGSALRGPRRDRPGPRPGGAFLHSTGRARCTTAWGQSSQVGGCGVTCPLPQLPRSLTIRYGRCGPLGCPEVTLSSAASGSPGWPRLLSELQPLRMSPDVLRERHAGPQLRSVSRWRSIEARAAIPFPWSRRPRVSQTNLEVRRVWVWRPRLLRAFDAQSADLLVEAFAQTPACGCLGRQTVYVVLAPDFVVELHEVAPAAIFAFLEFRRPDESWRRGWRLERGRRGGLYRRTDVAPDHGAEKQGSDDADDCDPGEHNGILGQRLSRFRATPSIPHDRDLFPPSWRGKTDSRHPCPSPERNDRRCRDYVQVPSPSRPGARLLLAARARGRSAGARTVAGSLSRRWYSPKSQSASASSARATTPTR